jgi:choline dehydrogenase-like flavoprotein
MHDLIIVGAGTAGCILAERLTRSGQLKVLLIEAGGPPASRFVSIPAGFSKLFKSHLDWAFESEPQMAVGGRRIFIPRGKMLGGSSNISAQIHQWCHPADFDGWVASGAPGWGWTDVAPAFRSQEGWRGEDRERFRGHDGPMVVSPNRNARPLSYAFVEAARRAGLGEQPHYNGGAYAGAWICELAQKDGTRFSAYDAYLKAAMRRSNLEVVIEAHATRVVLEGGRATGVSVRRGDVQKVLAAHGVVLAAGAFGSPQLLMLSGVGPAATLAGLGIPVHYDAPEVGANLQDHPVLPMVFRTRGTNTFKNAESPLSLLRYLVFKSGMLASNGCEAFAFAEVHPSRSAAPNLELIFVPFDFRGQFLEPPQVHAFSIGAAVVSPRSRGRVMLRSADPLAPLGIDFGLLSDPEGIDASVLWAGVRLGRRIAATAPLEAENAGELRPGEAVEKDSDLLAYACKELQTVYHPTSTCRMGSDSRAVVDSQLRVLGVDHLWVADASVMPCVPRGHPNAVVAMIAQRAACWIEAAIVP